ncbi:hypothetical protein ACFQ9U_34280 [Streptomyces sp. NPDC056568]|uniref:hypothetical protein n=1 Tax=Streptomyces sp. NPDC056568 TaxID=3345866 RepID=UPI0036B1B467
MSSLPLGSEQAGVAPAVCVVRSELMSALQAQGAHGQRALSLLLDSAQIMNAPAVFQAPYEVAQSCLRGALDSVLKIAGEDFPGLRSATEAVTKAAGAVADAWRHRGGVGAGDLDVLVGAVDQLRAEQENRGGFRTRQIGHLVLEQTRQEMGLAETEAARRWSAFYSAASGVLHGSSSGASEARHQFYDVTAAMEHLFLSLPERADRLRELARLDGPVEQDADEVARMTDPRAGVYFFQAAVSGRWLDLLPLSRLLPEERRWPAGQYLRRLLADEPERVCAWVEENLDAICARGPGALSQAVGVVSETGIAACALLAGLVRAQPERFVLIRVADWARDVPVAERTGLWVRVLEGIVRARTFTAHESWESGQVLRELVDTAHPGGRLRTGKDRLGVIIRSALADVLADHLNDESAGLQAELVNELGTITLTDPPRVIVVTLMRAVLDLALAEAQLGVPVGQRLRGVHGKLPATEHRARLVAVHLTESWPHDSQRAEAAAEWWRTAVDAAREVGSGTWPSADLADFLALLDAHCPQELRAQLEAALGEGLGAPPDVAQMRAWADAFPGPVPRRWRVVRRLSPVLPEPVRGPWEPVLALLEEKYGAPPGRPEPVVKTTSWVEAYGGLSVEVFSARVQADGAVAAVAALAAARVADDDDDADEDRAGLLGELVAQDLQAWAVDPAAVAAAAARPVLQAAYFNALHHAAGKGMLDPGVLGALAEAAFAFRPREADGPQAVQLQLVISNLLHRAWDSGASLGAMEADAVAWLRDLVTGWSTPRLGTSSPLGMATTAPGGSALLSLTAWGGQSAVHTADGLPEELTTTLETLLGAEPADDQALAVIGFCLALLHRCDPAWTAGHVDTLLPLEPAWRPARVWLAHGKPDAALLARLNRPGLWRVLCAPDAEGAHYRVLRALLDDAEPLGPAGEFLAGLAGCPGGTVAVSAMLSQLATYTAGSESGEVTERAAGLWRAALGAGLPAAALRGVGHFVFAACLDQDLWLELTVATLAQQPDLEDADYLVKRAGRTPASPGAQFIAAAALDHGPVDGYRARTVRRAADLYAAAPAETTPEREALRVALINAGAIDDAYGS